MEISLKITREDLLTNEMIIGRPKVGKSVAIMHQISSLVQVPNLSIMAFDVEGNLVRVLDNIRGKNVFILACGRDGNFRFNPLDFLDGATVEENTDDFLRSIKYFWLGIASEGVLKPIVKELMEDAMNGIPRTMDDLARAVSQLRRDPTRDKVLNRLAVLEAPVFRTTAHLDMNIIANNHIMFLVDELDVQACSFLFNSLLSRLMRYKRVVTKEHFKDAKDQHINILILDEAQRFLPAADTTRDDLAFLVMPSAWAMGRKLGIGMICALQQPTLVHGMFLTQVGLILAGALNSTLHVRTVAMALGLTREQEAFYQTMPQKMFLVRKTESFVFPMTIPEVNVSNRVFDNKAVDEWNNEVVRNIPALRELIKSDKPEGKNGGFFVQPERAKPPKAESVQQPKGTPAKDDYLRFLEVINDHPCHRVTWYYKHFDANKIFALQKSDRLRRELEKNGFIQVHQIRTGKRISKGIEITEKAYTQYSLKKHLYHSRGADFEHTYLVESLKNRYQLDGRHSTKEKKLDNHYSDLFVDPDLAIEVSIGNKPEYEIPGIIADLAHAEKVLVVGNDIKHLDKIRKLLPSDVTGKVEFKLFCEIVK